MGTSNINPIRSGLFQTVNDPGGGFESPPPMISKTIVSIFTISYMGILPGVSGMIQLEFFKNSRFWPFHSDFKLKSSENSCKNDIFVILFKIRLQIHQKTRNFNANLMQLVPDRYDYQVTRNCNFCGQSVQSCQEICKCNNFHLFTINGHKF